MTKATEVELDQEFSNALSKRMNQYVILVRKLIGSDLIQLRQYVDEVQERIDKKKFKASKKIAEVEDVDPMPTSLRLDPSRIQKYDKTFVGILNNGAFMSAFALFEGCLGRICWYAHKRYKSRLNPTDLKGEGIERMKLFLTKVIELDLGKLETQWQIINDHKQFRNHLIHQPQASRSSREQLPKSIQTNRYVEMISSKWQKSNLIINNKQFTLNFIEVSEGIVHEIISELIAQKGY